MAVVRPIRAALGATVLVALVLVLVLRVAGSHGQTAPDPRRSAPVAGQVGAAVRARIAPALAQDGRVLGAQLARWQQRRAAHRRTVELHALRRSRTVRAALRRMWLAGAIHRDRYLYARTVLQRAARTAARLHGARAAELRAVLRIPAMLARQRLLTSGRLTLVLLTIERNARFWALWPWPADGQRLRFGDDPVVFRYEPGQGLQVHMLSTAGFVNGLARDCAYRPSRCDRRRLRRALGRLRAIAARRGGFVAWESLYRFDGGTPPWISAMTQGTAIQALARGARALGEHRWLVVARAALGAFEQRPPVGVSVPAPGGRAYLMYSFAPGTQILNGFLQAITGLHDLAVISGSTRAERLFARGDRAARAGVARFDTGAWSLYALGAGETDLNYHELTTAFLRNLCRRTDARAYCATARRFARYEREPPRIDVPRLRGLRSRREVRVAFALSKVSDVRVAIGDTRGAVVLLDGRVARGGHAAAWTPPHAGRYRLQIVATGLSGPRAVAVRDLVVHRVRHPHRHGRKTG